MIRYSMASETFNIKFVECLLRQGSYTIFPISQNYNLADSYLILQSIEFESQLKLNKGEKKSRKEYGWYSYFKTNCT